MTDAAAHLDAAEARAARIVADLTSDASTGALADCLAAVHAAETLKTLLLRNAQRPAHERVITVMMIDAVAERARAQARSWLADNDQLLETQ